MIPRARAVRLKLKVRGALEALCRAPSDPRRDVKRARIALLVSEDAARGPSPRKRELDRALFSNWRKGSAEDGPDGLKESSTGGHDANTGRHEREGRAQNWTTIKKSL
jgi:hypothetical protein